MLQYAIQLKQSWNEFAIRLPLMSLININSDSRCHSESFYHLTLAAPLHIAFIPLNQNTRHTFWLHQFHVDSFIIYARVYIRWLIFATAIVLPTDAADCYEIQSQNSTIIKFHSYTLFGFQLWIWFDQTNVKTSQSLISVPCTLAELISWHNVSP